MEWSDLQVVLALSRRRTLSAAGSELGVNHSTVGRRLRALEQGCGARLFDRTPEGYVATTQGAMVETQVHGLEARVLGQDARLEGKLRVTTMDILYRRYHAAFTQFVERHPGIELTLTCNDAEASLLRREADVALRMTSSPPEYLVGRKVGKVQFAVYAARSLVTRVGRKAPLGRYPWLHWDERLDARWLDQWLGEHAKGARIALRVDGTSLSLRELVASGVGVHFLATFEGDFDPGLVRVSDVQEAFTRDLWLLTLPELKGTTRVRALLDHLGAALA